MHATHVRSFPLVGNHPFLRNLATRHRPMSRRKRLAEDTGVFAGESIMRRLDRLAHAVGLEAETEAA